VVLSEAFKQSIVKTLEPKFLRGASTISMQLVKNAFESEKTVSRKLEEILLVYILENNRIVSKERMKVYLTLLNGVQMYME
jgi:membrane peptidoglycan carboxypeptidase